MPQHSKWCQKGSGDGMSASMRNKVIEECARHIENRGEAFGSTFAEEIRELKSAEMTDINGITQTHRKRELTMDDFQRRVVDEKAELDGRLARLCEFSNKPIFAGLPIIEQERLNTQRHLMCALSAVLGERIAAFES